MEALDKSSSNFELNERFDNYIEWKKTLLLKLEAKGIH